MNKGHPDKKRDYAGNHELVLGKESICPFISTDDSDEDDDERETGAPPANQQSGIVLCTRMRIWWDISVYSPGDELGERGGHCPAGSWLPEPEMQCKGSCERCSFIDSENAYSSLSQECSIGGDPFEAV